MSSQSESPTREVSSKRAASPTRIPASIKTVKKPTSKPYTQSNVEKESESIEQEEIPSVASVSAMKEALKQSIPKVPDSISEDIKPEKIAEKIAEHHSASEAVTPVASAVAIVDVDDEVTLKNSDADKLIAAPGPNVHPEIVESIVSEKTSKIPSVSIISQKPIDSVSAVVGSSFGKVESAVSKESGPLSKSIAEKAPSKPAQSSVMTSSNTPPVISNESNSSNLVESRLNSPTKEDPPTNESAIFSSGEPFSNSASTSPIKKSNDSTTPKMDVALSKPTSELSKSSKSPSKSATDASKSPVKTSAQVSKTPVKSALDSKSPGLISSETSAAKSPLKSQTKSPTKSPEKSSPITPEQEAMEKLSQIYPAKTEPTTSSSHKQLEKDYQDLQVKFSILEQKHMSDRGLLREMERLRQELEASDLVRQKQSSHIAQLQQECKEARRALSSLQTESLVLQEQSQQLSDMLENACIDREMAQVEREIAEKQVQELQERVELLEIDLELTVEERELERIVPELDTSDPDSLKTQNERLMLALMLLRQLQQDQERDFQLKMQDFEGNNLQMTEFKVQNERLKKELMDAEQVVSDLKSSLDDALGASELVEQLSEKNLLLSEVCA